MRLLLAVSFLSLTSCISQAYAGDFLVDGGCITVGADAGNFAVFPVAGGTQFSVTTNFAVNYRVCKPTLADGGSPCNATSTDAPIPVTTAPIDLCQPTGYTKVGVYKLYDGGNPSVCVYAVSPKTVCQLP